LGNHDEERLEKRLVNLFYGSLESLKDMSNLKHLNITNTDIDDELKHLPKNIKLSYLSS